MPFPAYDISPVVESFVNGTCVESLPENKYSPSADALTRSNNLSFIPDIFFATAFLVASSADVELEAFKTSCLIESTALLISVIVASPTVFCEFVFSI